jgi:hypothetical protein
MKKGGKSSPPDRRLRESRAAVLQGLYASPPDRRLRDNRGVFSVGLRPSTLVGAQPKSERLPNCACFPALVSNDTNGPKPTSMQILDTAVRPVEAAFRAFCSIRLDDRYTRTCFHSSPIIGLIFFRLYRKLADIWPTCALQFVQT